MNFKKLGCLALALVTALSLTACGGSETQEAQQPADGGGDAAPADTIVIGRAYDSDNLDPVVQVGNYNIWILDLMLEGLVQCTDDGSAVEPCLATDWTISDDGLTYTFNLKEGLRFSDGTPVTGEDWVFSFERAMSMPDESW